ncbi:hypothetical protein FV219_01350 [Methylobacterium sp. WL122]|nr:hypothetical protein FV219_01350 [Methylobacterium sp. WL122]
MRKDLAKIQNDAWSQMAAILAVPVSDQETFAIINAARFQWTYYGDKPEHIEPSAEMKRNLEKTASLAFELRSLAHIVREYHQLQALLWHNKQEASDTDPWPPFSDQQLQTLSQMGLFAQDIADNLNIARGSKGDTPRRVSWIAAADLYEKTTGRTAYYSLNSQQEIDGPFTRYLMAFCRFCFPASRHDAESVEAFCKWLHRVRKGGGHPSLQVLGLDTVQT